MSEQEKKSKEQLILEVAESEFFSKGFDGTRTVVIAQKAGVTHAMLHYYFRTKEQLFDRIISDKFELISQMVLNLLKAIHLISKQLHMRLVQQSHLL